MNAIKRQDEFARAIVKSQRMEWYEVFLLDGRWPLELSRLVTGDATLALAAIVGAYAHLADLHPQAVDVEDAGKMVRTAVIEYACFLSARWQNNPTWCGSQFRRLSSDLQLPFLACIVLGWHDQRARSILRDHGGTLEALLAETTVYFQRSAPMGKMHDHGSKANLPMQEPCAI